MSDSELHSLLAEFNIAAMTAIALYLTAASGYLAAAYLVGDKLTRPQNLTISMLFVWFSMYCCWGTVAYFQRIDYLYSLLAVKPPGASPKEWIPFVAGSFELLGVFACLKFMHDIRSSARDAQENT